MSSLSGISKCTPSRRGLMSGKARTGTYSVPALTGTSSAPGHLTDAPSVPSQWAQPHLSASASHVGATDILTLLIKASAMVTVYRGHRRALLPARDYLPVHHVHRNH